MSTFGGLVSHCLPSCVPVLDGASAFPRPCLPLSPIVSGWCARLPKVSPFSPIVSEDVSAVPRPCLPACLSACLPSCLPACLPTCLSSCFILWRGSHLACFPKQCTVRVTGSPPIKLGGVKKCKLQKNRVEGVKKIMLHLCNFLKKCNLHFLRETVKN